MEKEEGLVVRGRVEIDMRKPFRSVKEAVMLFGESVLAGEIYGNRLKEMQVKASENGQYESKVGAVTAELEVTKQSLQKAKQEGDMMAYCLTSLKEELEQTKRELKHLKASQSQKQQLPHDPEIEELKFIENATKIDVMDQIEDGSDLEYQKKRSVKFASPPSLAKVIVSKHIGEVHVSIPKKKTKRKPLIPLIGGIFSRKKGTREGDSPRA